METNDLKPITSDLKEVYVEFIEEYLSNGYNQTQAYKTAFKTDNYNTAGAGALACMKRPEVKAYLEQRKQELKTQLNIKSIDVLKKLQTWANSDATQYIGMSEDDIKALPAEVRQSIQSIDVKKETYTNKAGKEITKEQIKIVLVDKAKALDNIAKHIGFYGEHNAQKAGANASVTLEQLAKIDPSLLEALHNIKIGKTIDISHEES